MTIKSENQYIVESVYKSHSDLEYLLSNMGGKNFNITFSNSELTKFYKDLCVYEQIFTNIIGEKESTPKKLRSKNHFITIVE
jgi:hypothetical protein